VPALFSVAVIFCVVPVPLLIWEEWFFQQLNKCKEIFIEQNAIVEELSGESDSKKHF
jgi:hypothetical protein